MRTPIQHGLDRQREEGVRQHGTTAQLIDAVLGADHGHRFSGRFARRPGGLEAALLAWNRAYEQMRPHQALGYKAPEQFYQDWLKNSYTRQEVLSDMY